MRVLKPPSVQVILNRHCLAMTKPVPLDLSKASGRDVRLAARSGALTGPTTGLAPGYIQTNIITLPSRYASDFRLLCQRNPVPCPLLAESAAPGDYKNLISYIPGFTGEQLAKDLDIRRDAPRYTVYENAELVHKESGRLDLERLWTDDHVAFLIGCSFSFEDALMRAGLTVNHIQHGSNVPMYRTNIPLCASGPFQESTYVVSMRPYAVDQIEAVRAVTRPYTLTHGEPIAWGWKKATEIGIQDITQPEWGDAPVCRNGAPFTKGAVDEVPVFWGCGVTPQNAVLGSQIEGTVLGHLPGHMLILDLKEGDVFKV